VIIMSSGIVPKLALAILILSLGSVFLSGQSVQVSASPSPTYSASSNPSWYWNSTYSCYYGYYPSYYCSYYYGYPYYNYYGYGYPYYYDYYYDYSYYNTPAKYSLTVSTDPTNLGSVSGSGTYDQGTSASFSVTKSVIQSSSNTRYVFSHWAGDYSGVGDTGSLTMDAAHNVVAVYQLQYYLSVSAQTQNAPVPQGEGWYNAGDSATLTAAGPTLGGDDGSRLVFQGWSIDGSAVQSGITLNLKMDNSHSVSPVYQQQYYLTVLTDQGTAYGQGWYNEGATAQIYASTPVSTTYGVSILFNGWQGDVQSNSQSTSVVMDKQKTVIASWRTDPTILNLTIALGIIAAFLAAAGIIAYVAVSRTRYRQQAVPLVPKKTTDETTPEAQPVKKRATPPKKKPIPETEDTNPPPS
jgi:hypothetical protein